MEEKRNRRTKKSEERWKEMRKTRELERSKENKLMNKEGQRRREKEEAERRIFGECHLPNLVTMLSQL